MAGIQSAWVYSSGAAGLRRGNLVHITDKGQGNTQKPTDMWPNLPWADPDVIFGTYPSSGAIGFIKVGQVFVTDWTTTKTLHGQWPSLPSGWENGGIRDAWVYSSGATGLRKGNLVHITDKGQGNTQKPTDMWPNLPWADPDVIFGTYPSSGAMGFIKDNKVFVTDWAAPKTLAVQFSSLPDDWKSTVYGRVSTIANNYADAITVADQSGMTPAFSVGSLEGWNGDLPLPTSSPETKMCTRITLTNDLSYWLGILRTVDTGVRFSLGYGKSKNLSDLKPIPGDPALPGLSGKALRIGYDGSLTVQ